MAYPFFIDIVAERPGAGIGSDHGAFRGADSVIVAEIIDIDQHIRYTIRSLTKKSDHP